MTSRRYSAEFANRCAKAMRAGETIAAIADRVSMNKETLRTWLIKAGHDTSRRYPKRGSEAEAEAALLAAVPPDTRDLTGKLCGDPLPGRRALDRRRHG